MLVVSIAVLKQGAPLVADFGQTSKLISIDRNLMSWLQLLALVDSPCRRLHPDRAFEQPMAQRAD